MLPSFFQLSDPKLHSLGPVSSPPCVDSLVWDPSHPTQVLIEGTLHCILPMIPGEGQVLHQADGVQASRPGKKDGDGSSWCLLIW